MDRYTGLDSHASSCAPGVVGPGGKRLGSHLHLLHLWVAKTHPSGARESDQAGEWPMPFRSETIRRVVVG